MLSLARFSSIGVRLPIQTSSANTAPVASIFIPEMVTPSSASAMTRRVGVVARFSSEDFPATDAGRWRHGKRDIEIVLACMFVIAGKILPKPRIESVQYPGLHFQ